MGVSLWKMLVVGSVLGVALQLPPVAERRQDADDLAVIRAALTATALADLRRAHTERELLVLDETVVFCSSNRRLRAACIPESADLPAAERTLVPLRLPALGIAATRTVAHATVEDMFVSGGPDFGWAKFHTTFPNVAGFAGVSAPAYDAGTARVYVTFIYGNLGAKGWLVHLGREGDAWRVTQVQLGWMS